MIFAHIESFHNKSLFYSNYKKFWVVQNSFPIIKKLDKINAKRNAKNISTFDFSTFYTTLPHNLLIEVLNNLIGFVFKSKIRKKLAFQTLQCTLLLKELVTDSSQRRLWKRQFLTLFKSAISQLEILCSNKT